MFQDLVENITLLISLCWLQGMIMRYLDGYELLSKVCGGGIIRRSLYCRYE
jgi:hypothetical protein